MSNQPQIITAAERAARKLAAQEAAAKAAMPSHWQMLKNLVGAAKDVIAEGPEARSSDEIEIALKTCAGCVKLVNDNGKFRCGQCGCFLGGVKGQGLVGTSLGKVSMRSWHCPLGKW